MEWHRDNCLTLTVQMEGWEEGMAMTWRGEQNTVEKVNLQKSVDKQRQSVTQPGLSPPMRDARHPTRHRRVSEGCVSWGEIRGETHGMGDPRGTSGKML